MTLYIYLKQKKQYSLFRFFSQLTVFVLSFSLALSPAVSYAQTIPQTILNLPIPGTMVPVTAGFAPLIIKGVNIYPDNPLKLDFIIDRGDTDLNEEEFKINSEKLIKYFLASLTVPEEEMWVNLSPYEKDRIIPGDFGKTEMGRDLLAQDYLLKQLTSSLMYPENELGKEFWDRVYKKAQEQFSTTEIPMNTFNKIWIVPQEAFVYEHTKGAFVVSSHLKVMLEEDYIALEANKNSKKHGLGDVTKDEMEVISGMNSQVVREVLIPEIEKEVNEGSTFANLRQIYNSVILASWYKQALKESLLGQVYVNKKKTVGVEVNDKEINEKIYNQYVEAFKKGVYNYIKEDIDPVTNEMIPRKYFSGGIKFDPRAELNIDGEGSFGQKETVSVDSPLAQQIVRDGVKGDVVTVNVSAVSNAVNDDNYATAASPVSDGDIFVDDKASFEDRFTAAVNIIGETVLMGGRSLIVSAYHEEFRDEAKTFLLKALRGQLDEYELSWEEKLEVAEYIIQEYISRGFLEVAAFEHPNRKEAMEFVVNAVQEGKIGEQRLSLNDRFQIAEYVFDVKVPIGNIFASAFDEEDFDRVRDFIIKAFRNKLEREDVSLENRVFFAQYISGVAEGNLSAVFYRFKEQLVTEATHFLKDQENSSSPLIAIMPVKKELISLIGVENADALIAKLDTIGETVNLLDAGKVRVAIRVWDEIFLEDKFQRITNPILVVMERVGLVEFVNQYDGESREELIDLIGDYAEMAAILNTFESSKKAIIILTEMKNNISNRSASDLLFQEKERHAVYLGQGNGERSVRLMSFVMGDGLGLAKQIISYKRGVYVDIGNKDNERVLSEQIIEWITRKQDIFRQIEASSSLKDIQTKRTVVSSSIIASDEIKGGIDLNPTMLNMNIQRDGNGVALPASRQSIENINVRGFIPVIINITPIVNLPLLIGLVDTEKESDSVSYNSTLSPADQKLRFGQENSYL